jgi:hypothetical protein
MNIPSGIWNYGDAWNNYSGDPHWLLTFATLKNVQYIIYHKDVREDYINQTIEKMMTYEQKGDLKKISENEYFALYKINQNYFLPSIYTPTSIIVTGKNVNQTPEILEAISAENKSRPAILFDTQNPNKNEQISNIQSDPSKPPVLEFKKINPTKYRVRVHGAQKSFALVLSETYHDGWDVYSVSPSNQNHSGQYYQEMVSKYQKTESIDEQPGKEELNTMIGNGWVTELGDGGTKFREHTKWADDKRYSLQTEPYNVDFISKNIQGTIQNDNLPNGPIHETLFDRPIDQNKHLKVNSYANAWIIEPESICKESKCILNQDQTYDFELVIEFWPQRLFYIGLAITITTLAACLAYLCYDWRRKKGALWAQKMHEKVHRNKIVRWIAE